MAYLPPGFGIMSQGIRTSTSVQALTGYTCRRNQNARILDGSTPLQLPLLHLFRLEIQQAMKMNLIGVIHPFWATSHCLRKCRWFRLYLCNRRHLVPLTRLRDRVQVPPVGVLDLLHGEIARSPHLFLNLASLLPVFICRPLPVVPARVPLPLTCLVDADALLLNSGAPLLNAGAPLLNAGAPLLNAGALLLDAGALPLDAGAFLLGATFRRIDKFDRFLVRHGELMAPRIPPLLQGHLDWGA